METRIEAAKGLKDIGIQNYLAPGQAAMLAVLCADVREVMEEVDGENEKAEAFLYALEQVGIEAIREQDGKVTFWLGKAAKQMNPLLCNG